MRNFCHQLILRKRCKLAEEKKESEYIDRSKLLKDFEFEEEQAEIIVDEFTPTGFPKPVKSYRLVWEVFDLSLEEPYFWILDILKGGFPIIEKLEDSFAAAENSAFFGVSQQRLGAQQGQVSQFLATVGKMIKELFQMVRELRVLDERMAYYEDAEKQLSKPLDQRGKMGEITLKGLFVDLVQGGGKSAASVYGMARELEFLTLPDLFFDAPPFKDSDELEKYIAHLEESFNRNVLRVLSRHLNQFTEWKKRTHQEHKSRRRFMLQYLLQHFEIIKMYVNWIKPYLKHVSRLTLKEKSMDSADLVSSFEGSMLDIEFLARKEEVIKDGDQEKDRISGCVLATFNYRTRAEMKVQQEGFQRGPVHIGRFELTLRVYVWNKKQVANYKKLKEEEIFFLMGSVSSSIKEAMNALGKELDVYIEEAKKNAGVESKKEEKAEEKKEEKEDKKKSFVEKFMGEYYTPKDKKSKSESSELSKHSLQKIKETKDKMRGHAVFQCWLAYQYFKKAHRMIAW